ncbi:TerC family protein [Calderihabitans maritimus]|uniref:Integral membrane protein TerC n=1 Tax=Calderihabitans maritimus TaxID=1246530 RepID=A0A1Z5HW64_9FIRM|nr:TerC family protein [Calderihabitans maritimus]GAW93510.1 putative protein [Calderihabitans maritimus]
MDGTLLLEYAWTLIVIVGLEGILAADNALVLAIMVKHLPEKARKKALLYGLGGAFLFRFASLFIISFLVGVWQVQAIGAAYLLFISINHIVKEFFINGKEHEARRIKTKKGEGFWTTVIKVELADIAFAVDSILAAVALALTLPDTNLPPIGSLDGAKFLVIIFGGLIGVVIMRFAANWLVNILNRKPGLETAAFILVGWVGIKLAIHALAHHQVAIIPEEFPESPEWKIIFWSVMIAVAAGGWFLSKDKGEEDKEVAESP